MFINREIRFLSTIIEDYSVLVYSNDFGVDKQFSLKKRRMKKTHIIGGVKVMKKFIRKVAAVGVGSGMLLGTFGALAAGETLSDLPAPFVKSSSYNDLAFVVGSSASGRDNTAGNSVINYFSGMVTSEVGSILSSSKTEKIFIGENLSQEFSTSLDDGDLSIFWDDGIDFRGGNYETHEEILVSANDDGAYLVSSGLTGEEELGSDLKIYTNGANVSWAYRYVFDEEFAGADAINSSKELDITFLGRDVRISDVVDGTTDSVTLTTGLQTSQGMDTSFQSAGHTVNVGTIFETKVEIWVDNEAHQFMDEGDVETFNIGADKVEVKVDDIGYTDDVTSRTILITTGENIDTTVKHGDAVQTELGEPDVDDDASDAVWNWDIITSAGADHFNKTDYIGVYYNQKVNKWNDVPAPLGSGESWRTPFGYVTMDMEVPEVDYKEYSFIMIENQDINATEEQDVLEITAVGQASSNDGLDYEGQDTNRILVNGSGYVYYEDSDGDFQIGAGTALANGTTQGGADTLSIEASSDSSKWILFKNVTNVAIGSSDTPTFMIIEDVESGDENLYTGSNITSNVSIANFRFGANAESDDVGDLSISFPATAHGIAATRSVQTWDAGVAVTMYGSVLSGLTGIGDGDLESGLDNDEFHLWIPEDEVYALVTFNVRSAGTSTDPVLITESAAGSYGNLILVGGPCVNSLTAEWMGLSFPSCGSASGITENKATIDLMEKGGKSALIVAGWEQADTQRAAGAISSAKSAGGTSYIVA